MPYIFVTFLLWLLALLMPALAGPRTGPDRPFTLEWKLAVPPTESLQAVHFTDAKAGLAVGEGGAILLTRDGGESWRPAQVPPGTAAGFGGVALAADGKAGLAVGSTSGGAGVILLTRDGGESWRPAQVPPGTAAGFY